MQATDALAFPKLRPVEVRQARDHPGAYQLFDPSGISTSVFTVSAATLAILAGMDGQHDRAAIQVEFLRRHGRLLFSDELNELIRQLDNALLLDGPAFEVRLQQLEEAYRRSTSRPIRDVHTLGAPVERLGEYLDSFLNHQHEAAGANAGSTARHNQTSGGPVAGLIAPHLDYRRGFPCYAAAYADLAHRTDAQRFVILGTNHFGRCPFVVGTRKDFQTPFGLVPHDEAFMDRLNERLGLDLCEGEHDHVREHSIELQVILLKHLLPDRAFTIVPYLCPDPCGPSGTAPRDGRGVDLKAFAEALGEQIEADPVPTCLIAGADLSHVGRYFNDDRNLDADSLHAIESSDRRALAQVEAGEPEAFRQAVSAAKNATNICSVGCIYALTTALKGRASARLLRYHQAITPEQENCVTCAALEFLNPT